MLSFHLKRFRFSRQSRSKIDTFVSYPLQGLDMTRYMNTNHPSSSTSQPSHIYDLYGVIVHHGSSNSGHYFAFVWSAMHKKWFEMNDNAVKCVQEDAVLNQNAYMLFYVRRSVVFSPGDAKGRIDGDAVVVAKKKAKNGKSMSPRKGSPTVNKIDTTLVQSPVFAENGIQENDNDISRTSTISTRSSTSKRRKL